MAPSAIVSVSALFEQLQPEFTWTVALDKSDATMSIIAKSDPGGVCNTSAHLVAGYAEDVDECVTLDNVHDALQLILPLVGVDPVPSGRNTRQLVRHNPIMFPYRGQQCVAASGTTPMTQLDCYKLYARAATVKPHGSKDALKVPYSLLRPESPNYFRYQYYTFDVDFSAIDYPIVEDGNVTTFQINGKDCWEEWTRNARIRFNPYLDVLTMEGGQVQFAENPNPNPDGLNVLGNSFNAPFKLLEKKGVISVSWLDVPADYILDNNPASPTYRRPVHIQAALGKVNSEEFLGCEPETLLLREAPEMISKPYGAFYRTFRQHYHFEWLYDIHFKLIFFDPPRGNTTGTHRGHNIYAPKGQNYYLYVTRPPFNQSGMNPNNPNIPNNPAIFETYDFRKMFQDARTVF